MKKAAAWKRGPEIAGSRGVMQRLEALIIASRNQHR